MILKFDTLELSHDSRISNVVLINAKQDGILMLSRDIRTDEIYLEWNEQSKSMYNAIEKCELIGNHLIVFLNENGRVFFGHTQFETMIPCAKSQFAQLKECLIAIFENKILIQAKEFEFIAEPIIEYEKILYLNFNSKNLTELPKDFEKYSNVEELYLLNNPNLNLNSSLELIKKLPKLKKLHLGIYGAIPNQLSELIQLTELHMEGSTDFRDLPEDLGGLKNLKYLYLQSDTEIILPNSVSLLSALENLQVRTSNWTLPSDFYKLKKLKELDLLNCGILTFPKEMDQMSYLETIYVGINDNRDYNKILSIFGTLPNLKRLELNVLSLPDRIDNCINLEELTMYGDVQHENAFMIPSTIGKLIHLKILQFVQCKMDTFPMEISRLQNLSEISFRECIMSALPLEIYGITNLQQLSISESEWFESIPETISNLKLLRVLHLSELPNITSLPTALAFLPKLERIVIQDCDKLKNIPSQLEKFMDQS